MTVEKAVLKALVGKAVVVDQWPTEPTHINGILTEDDETYLVREEGVGMVDFEWFDVAQINGHGIKLDVPLNYESDD